MKESFLWVNRCGVYNNFFSIEKMRKIVETLVNLLDVYNKNSRYYKVDLLEQRKSCFKFV